MTLLKEFTVLINKCFTTGIFPHAWKLATVVLIPKKGEIYLNILKNIPLRGYLNLYADDTCISVSSNSIDNLIKDLNSDLDNFAEWCIYNKLTVNSKKKRL